LVGAPESRLIPDSAANLVSHLLEAIFSIVARQLPHSGL
jgi:hypothetical protein